MAEIKVIKYGSQGLKAQHDPSLDSVKFSSFLTANYELTDAKLGKLIDGVDAADEHIHDARYYRQNQFISVSTGASDASKPLITDAGGKIDESFLDISAINALLDHGALLGLGDDDHTQYILVDASRAFTGAQSMGGFNLTNVADPTLAQHAATKAYVDAVATGLRPKGDVEAATVSAGVLASDFEAGDIIDGYTLVAGDRILIKNQADAKENGIYVVQASGAPVRSEDQDNSPLAEIVNGVWVPNVLNGTVNAGKAYFISSQGTGTNGEHVIGTDDINWSLFTSPTQLTEGNGIDISGNVISVELLASGGLKFVGTALAVEPADFAGEGLIDDGSDNLAIDWSTAFNDSKAIKASDLSSTANGFGASIIGVEDANSYFTSTNQEGVNNELYLLASAGDSISYTAGVGGVAKGQLVYLSGNDTVSTYSDITQLENVVGITLAAATAGNPVKVVRFDKALTGVLTGATAGQEYFWNGSALVTTAPSTATENVWLVGIAKNATDLSIEVRHLYTVS